MIQSGSLSYTFLLLSGVGMAYSVEDVDIARDVERRTRSVTPIKSTDTYHLCICAG